MPITWPEICASIFAFTALLTCGAIGLAWFVILPVIGLLWCCGVLT